MAKLGNSSMALLFAIEIFMLSCLHFPTDAQIGVAYGRNGDNLPSPNEVVSFYKSHGIGSMRLYTPDPDALQAVTGSGITVALGLLNDDVPMLGSDDSSAANQWVQTNVLPYASSIKYIVIGNEVPANTLPVLKAMQNVLTALNNNVKGNQIKVTTSIGTSLVKNLYPPSAGEFSDPSYMTPIINFLKDNGSPFMVSIYPYFAHLEHPVDISLEYALFTMPYEKAKIDHLNGLTYQNVFDALADATYAAVQKVVGAFAEKVVGTVGEQKVSNRAPDVRLLTSESGWADGGFSSPLPPRRCKSSISGRRSSCHTRKCKHLLHQSDQSCEARDSIVSRDSN